MCRVGLQGTAPSELQGYLQIQALGQPLWAAFGVLEWGKLIHGLNGCSTTLSLPDCVTWTDHGFLCLEIWRHPAKPFSYHRKIGHLSKQGLPGRLMCQRHGSVMIDVG